MVRSIYPEWLTARRSFAHQIDGFVVMRITVDFQTRSADLRAAWSVVDEERLGLAGLQGHAQRTTLGAVIDWSASVT